MLNGTEITLEEMLACREARAALQKKMCDAHRLAVLSFTMNIPGPVKTNAQIRAAFDEGCAVLSSRLADAGITVTEKRERHAATGDELMLALSGDAKEIKRIAVEIEETHPYGRLFDMDVLSPDAHILARKTPRRCIVCGKEGKACARNRTHALDELTRAVAHILSLHAPA